MTADLIVAAPLQQTPLEWSVMLVGAVFPDGELQFSMHAHGFRDNLRRLEGEPLRSARGIMSAVPGRAEFADAVNAAYADGRLGAHNAPQFRIGYDAVPRHRTAPPAPRFVSLEWSAPTANRNERRKAERLQRKDRK